MTHNSELPTDLHDDTGLTNQLQIQVDARFRRAARRGLDAGCSNRERGLAQIISTILQYADDLDSKDVAGLKQFITYTARDRETARYWWTR